jgi:hypothetical protein
MRNLKRLSMAFALIVVLGTSVLAGGGTSPACAPPDPGITETPPCAIVQQTLDDSSPQVESTVSSTSGFDASVTELAINLLETVLLLF